MTSYRVDLVFTSIRARKQEESLSTPTKYLNKSIVVLIVIGITCLLEQGQ